MDPASDHVAALGERLRCHRASRRDTPWILATDTATLPALQGGAMGVTRGIMTGMGDAAQYAQARLKAWGHLR